MLEKIYNNLKKNYRSDIVERIEKNYIDDEISSIFLRYDNENVLSQITIWEDLSCMIEIYDIDIDKYIRNQRMEFFNTQEVTNEFSTFISIISDFL